MKNLLFIILMAALFGCANSDSFDATTYEWKVVKEPRQFVVVECWAHGTNVLWQSNQTGTADYNMLVAYRLHRDGTMEVKTKSSQYIVSGASCRVLVSE